LSGVITLTSLGLVAVPERAVLNQWALLTGVALALMGFIEWHYRRAVAALGRFAGLRVNATQEMLSRPWDWVLVLINVIYQQIHWAFCRALPFLILDDRYVGGFLGLALALLEAYANPRVRDDLDEPVKAEFLLLSAGFAVVTTILFILTGASWLGAGIHLVFAVGWMLLIRGRNRLYPDES
jgi:hypothetical protein